MPVTAKNHSTCTKYLSAVRDALDVVSSKWKLQIIIALWAGNKRFKDIERQIGSISPRMLSKELKELEEHKLIQRKVYDTLPVSIEYTTTQHAETLKELVDNLQSWGIKHRNVVFGK
jgi:DNA-binding HxlR family transcriptional regulator